MGLDRDMKPLPHLNRKRKKKLILHKVQPHCVAVLGILRRMAHFAELLRLQVKMLLPSGNFSLPILSFNMN